MSTKANNEVAVEKATENDKASGDAKCELKGIKRAGEDKVDDVKKQKKEENGDGELPEDIEEETVDDEDEENLDGDIDEDEGDEDEGDEDAEDVEEDNEEEDDDIEEEEDEEDA